MSGIERLTEADTALGESPFWSVEEQALYWIDWETMEVLRLDWASGAVGRWAVGERMGCLVGRRGGGAVLALQSGFHAFDPTNGSSRLLARIPFADGAEPNDGKCDPRGRFWCGGMDPEGQRALGRLWRLDSDGTVSAHGDPLRMVNGLAWSADGGTFWVADSGAGTLHIADFDLEAGAPGPLRTFATVDGPAVPDGCTIDAEGFLWWTEFDGGRIVRYAPDGRIDRVVALPVSQPTSCLFAGPQLDRLVVTTARFGGDAARWAAEPLAGALLVLDVGTRGRPEPLFAG